MRKRMPRIRGNHGRQALKSTQNTLFTYSFKYLIQNDKPQMDIGHFLKIQNFLHNQLERRRVTDSEDSSPRGYSGDLALPRAQDCPSQPRAPCRHAMVTSMLQTLFFRMDIHKV